jgi:Ferritin-like
MSQRMQIVELMRVPAGNYDLGWLERSLQAAIALELATIPPYLTAYWSIKNPLDPSAASIREVCIEEMLHLGVCCNLLAAVGGAPALNTPDVVPRYPGPLPGGVHPGLEVWLEGLSTEVAKRFMDIEYPEGGPVAFREEFATIGEFYAAIDAALVSVAPSMQVERQLQNAQMPDLRVLSSLDDAREALTLIRRQGEGSKASPEETAGDLAHYYRFGEIYHGKKFRKHPITGHWDFDGDVVPFPDVWPVARVPAGGYTREQVAPQVWTLLMRFDRGFAAMMNQLHTAWTTRATDLLDAAVGTMFGLRRPAVDLMKIPIPGTTGNYAPCFRLA